VGEIREKEKGGGGIQVPGGKKKTQKHGVRKIYSKRVRGGSDRMSHEGEVKGVGKEEGDSTGERKILDKE